MSGYDRKEWMRAYQRRWIAGRRAAFFAGKACVECGSADRLELDHVDRATKVDHAIWSWSDARREAELAKCQVLCHDCHLAKTVAENVALAGPLVHGTERCYHHHRCRCGECRTAATAARQARRRHVREVMP
jgi:5-methylcytosine-specific restriction endonuclease McrA